MAGANPAAVQRILRHSDPRITVNMYGHLMPGYLRDEVDRLQFGPPKDSPPADTTGDADAKSASQIPILRSEKQPLARSLLHPCYKALQNRVRQGIPMVRIPPNLRENEWRARQDSNLRHSVP